MPATCPNCGRGIGRSDQFCDGCGAFLGWEAGASADSQPLPQGAPPQDDQRAAVQLQINSDLIKVTPGSAESTAFRIKNLGTQVEEFRFFVTGPDWIVVEPTTLSVYPGQEATGAIQAAPPRTPGSVAGITPFRLTVTSALHTHVSGSVAGRVDVAPYYDLAAELIPASSSGRGLTRHRIMLDNRGNVPLRIVLNPTDVADGLRLGVPAYADALPGTVTEVAVSVYGSRRWLGRREPKTFSIIAEAPKPLAATRLPGTRIVVPVFPSWVPAAAAGLAAVAIAAAVLVPKLKGSVQVGLTATPSSAQAGSSSSGQAGSSSSGQAGSSSSGQAGSSSSGQAGSSSSGQAGSSSSGQAGSSSSGQAGSSSSGQAGSSSSGQAGSSSSSSSQTASPSPSPTPSPVITAITPASGRAAGGTSVTITGTGLAHATSVSFGGATATITADSSTQITVTSPGGTGTVNITVTTPGGTATDTGQFTYIPQPTITNVSQASGPAAGGTSVTITGTGLAHATSVSFGGATATITADSSTQITVTSPGGTGTVNITVTTPGGTATAAGQFTYGPLASPTT